MIKIYFDSMAVFFEFESVWLGTLLYIGNNKFYFKYKSDEGVEDICICMAYNYIDAILQCLNIIGAREGRIERACKMTAQMLTRGGEVNGKN